MIRSFLFPVRLRYAEVSLRLAMHRIFIIRGQKDIYPRTAAASIQEQYSYRATRIFRALYAFFKKNNIFS